MHVARLFPENRKPCNLTHNWFRELRSEQLQVGEMGCCLPLNRLVTLGYSVRAAEVSYGQDMDELQKRFRQT
jgi:hypothetical protein